MGLSHAFETGEDIFWAVSQRIDPEVEIFHAVSHISPGTWGGGDVGKSTSNNGKLFFLEDI